MRNVAVNTLAIRNAALLLGCSLLLAVEPVYAGPGGKIASVVAETLWGKLLLGVLAIIFLPLICWVALQEYLASRRASRDLRYMAGYSPLFDWLKIRERAKDCFYRVHSAWEVEELAGVSEWMTDWYWQNQQMAHLDRWQREGLQNVCTVKKIKSIRPLLFVHRNQGAEHEDSMVALSITAEMQDYLQKRDSGELVEGSRKFKDVETIWTFTLSDGRWRVSDIDEGSSSLSFARLRRDLPPIESTVVAEIRA